MPLFSPMQIVGFPMRRRLICPRPQDVRKEPVDCVIDLGWMVLLLN